MSEVPGVIHNEASSRFELPMEGGVCIAAYDLIDGAMWITHTEVPRALQNRGLAAQVVRAALEHARAQGLKVKPACSYVRGYMRRHPETQDLLVAS